MHWFEKYSVGDFSQFLSSEDHAFNLKKQEWTILSSIQLTVSRKSSFWSFFAVFAILRRGMPLHFFLSSIDTVLIVSDLCQVIPFKVRSMGTYHLIMTVIENLTTSCEAWTTSQQNMGYDGSRSHTVRPASFRTGVPSRLTVLGKSYAYVWRWREFCIDETRR